MSPKYDVRVLRAHFGPLRPRSQWPGAPARPRATSERTNSGSTPSRLSGGAFLLRLKDLSANRKNARIHNSVGVDISINMHAHRHIQRRRLADMLMYL